MVDEKSELQLSPTALKVLIVEDEAVLRMDLQARLERLGHRVVGMADTAMESVRLATLLKPNLVFMDIRLKGKDDGISAADKIRHQHIPVIYLTAFNDSETLNRAKQTRPCAYLHKPFHEHDLRTAIEIGMHNAVIEERLRQSESRYKTTINNIDDGVIAVNPDGRVTLLNPLAEKLTGWREHEAIGQPLQQVFPVKTDRQSASDLATQVMRTGKQNKSASGTLLQRKDGSEVPISNSIAPIVSVPDEPACGAVIAFRDVSDELNREAYIRHVQKLESLAVMSSGIAHDFNNLLTPVMGFAGMLRSEVGTNPRANQMLDQIEMATKRAAELTRQLLAYTGKASLTVHTVNLNQLISDMLPLLKASISRKAVLQTSFSELLPLIEGDESQIRQVLINLVMNASEALSNGSGNITLKTRQESITPEQRSRGYGGGNSIDGEFIIVDVIDDGLGIAPDTMAKIFDPFFTTKFTGRGLGLSAVLGIVQSHRGMLFVESHVSQGSKFSIAFPKPNRPQSTGQTLGRQTPMNRTQPRILVIDDEAPIRTLLKSMLERAGYQPAIATDGYDAMQQFGDQLTQFDVMLIDMLMPRMDGVETVTQIRQRFPSAKIILMSGYSPQALSNQLNQLGICGLLQKPFQMQQVLSALASALQR